MPGKVERILRSPQEIYIRGPEHLNCTLKNTMRQLHNHHEHHKALHAHDSSSHSHSLVHEPLEAESSSHTNSQDTLDDISSETPPGNNCSARSHAHEDRGEASSKDSHNICWTLHLHGDASSETCFSTDDSDCFNVEHIYGVSVPSNPTHSTDIFVPEHLVYKLELPKKPSIWSSIRGIFKQENSGLEKSKRKKQGVLKQKEPEILLPNYHNQGTPRQRDPEPERSEQDNSTQREPKQKNPKESLRQVTSNGEVQVKNRAKGNEPEKARAQPEDLMLLRPAHIRPTLINCIPGFFGFTWYDEPDYGNLEHHNEQHSTFIPPLIPEIETFLTISEIALCVNALGGGESQENPADEPEALYSAAAAAAATEDDLGDNNNSKEEYKSHEFLLADYHMAFLIDDSVCMKGTRWTHMKAEISLMPPICARYGGGEGCDFHFVNTRNLKDPLDVRTEERALRLFDSVDPGFPKSPLGQRLHGILRPYMKRLRECGLRNLKPLHIIVLLAAASSDHEVLWKCLVDVATRLDELAAPQHQVSIQIFQVGPLPATKRALVKLRDDLGGEAKARNIVDLILWKADRKYLSMKYILDMALIATDRRRFQAPTEEKKASPPPPFNCGCC